MNNSSNSTLSVSGIYMRLLFLSVELLSKSTWLKIMVTLPGLEPGRS